MNRVTDVTTAGYVLYAEFNEDEAFEKLFNALIPAKNPCHGFKP